SRARPASRRCAASAALRIGCRRKRARAAPSSPARIAAISKRRCRAFAFLPSPLVGEGGFAQRSRVRGFSPQATLTVAFADATPHAALRATFSRKGRRKDAYFPFPNLANASRDLEASDPA